MTHHLRVHTKDLVKTDILEFLHQKSNVSIVCVEKESTEREHIHCVIELNKTLSTFRQQLLKKFPNLKGNGTYSLEEIKTTKERMIRYCCKGENKDTQPSILFSQNNINVLEEHNLYYEILSESEDKVLDNPNVKKSKVLSWSEKVFLEMNQKFPNEIKEIQSYSYIWKPTDEEIEILDKAKKTLWCYMIKCLGKSVKKINDNILRDLFNGLLNSINQNGENDANYALKLYKICYGK